MKQEAPAPLLEEGASLRLCEAVSRIRYTDLPPEVVRVLKAFLLDTLGVIGGAARAPGIPDLHARLTRWEAGGTATALIGKRRLSPPSAAPLASAAEGGESRRLPTARPPTRSTSTISTTRRGCTRTA